MSLKIPVSELPAGSPQSLPIEVDSGQLIPVSLETLPLNVPMPCGIYLKVAGRHVLFRNPGEKITQERVVALRQSGATTIFVNKSSWQLLVDMLEKAQPEEPVTPEARAEYIRNLLYAHSQELEQVKEPKKATFDLLKPLCDQLADTLAKDPAVGARLIRRHRDPELYFVEHTINVAIYATLIGRKLGVTGEKLRQLTFGALVHDVGFVHLPRKIAYCPNPLTPEQEVLYRDHARHGAELLLSSGAAPSVVTCALQHHEREDGEGYPGRLLGAKTHLHAKIVGIADTYDDLVGPHPGRAAMATQEAIDCMRRMQGRFDPKLMDLV